MNHNQVACITVRNFSFTRNRAYEEFDPVFVSIIFIRLALRNLCFENVMDYGDNDVVPPAIVLQRMPQQLEVRAPEDDWTGVTDPGERRRLQNRLNQRIYSKSRCHSISCRSI